MNNIVILTGAGISAESGLETFRSEDGLWAQHRIEDVATPEGFIRDPDLVLRFYNSRRADCAAAQPNAAHQALAALEQAPGQHVLLVTQNVDDLHERAGSRNVIHMHGALDLAKCHDCGHGWPAPAPARMSVSDRCPRCQSRATRPDIVWFGEMPAQMARIEAALARADLFVAIGTSGQVYPAAGFARQARLSGAATLELNLEPTALRGDFRDGRYGPAGEVVPAWVEEILRR
jgi:NAD-dependent protein deacetylase/lipoamidase